MSDSRLLFSTSERSPRSAFNASGLSRIGLSLVGEIEGSGPDSPLLTAGEPLRSDPPALTGPEEVV